MTCTVSQLICGVDLQAGVGTYNVPHIASPMMAKISLVG